MRTYVRDPFWLAFTASVGVALAEYAAFGTFIGLIIWSATAIVVGTFATEEEIQ